ncbi:MAG: hypothetical protein CME62_08500 [Halobacteriovoraceae bacterium]|nr:hypothetical protein [Halobacteriovoraceae bacterium]|tara:strand:- start:4950 stop:5639 length:690 start_codon:yes stop_codon:yes gene_type:complete
MKYYLCLFLLFSTHTLLAESYPLADETVVFPGRISKINGTAKLIRFKIDFENAKFLNRYHRVELWNPVIPEKKCLGFVEGRTNDYLLIRIPKYEQCKSTIYFAAGSYLHMYSPDLENALETASELQDILVKKHTALSARLNRYQRTMAGYIEKIDVINKRYEILRQKLELEWQKELSILEEDKSKSYALYQKTKTKLHELNYKMQQYRVRDQNLKEDRWSLDPELYYKK